MSDTPYRRRNNINLPKKKKYRTTTTTIVAFVLAFIALAITWNKTGGAGGFFGLFGGKTPASYTANRSDYTIDDIPEYKGDAYVTLNNNIPRFNLSDADKGTFETYSDLDSLGRVGVAYANLGKELMPTGKREDISMIKPTGWRTYKYADLIEDVYLYNRSHLIAFSLAGEDVNEKNLMTGTHYFNQDSMLPFEEGVREYINSTKNHVLYRVTPVFKGDEPVARGVVMEAYSVEDKGEGICFNVFVYNVQPGVEIDYATGKSKRAA